MKMIDYSTTTITELAAIIAEHLLRQKINVVLVGGLAVEIYSENLYLTKDIDMVDTSYRAPKVLHKAMAELGFDKQGRIFVNDTTDITVEFPPGPLSVGDEFIRNTTTVKVATGVIPILPVDAVVKDRLAAFVHWRDRQSLVQAIAIMLKHQLKPADFKTFCAKEGTTENYQQLSDLYSAAKRQKIKTMAEIESLLTQMLLDQL